MSNVKPSELDAASIAAFRNILRSPTVYSPDAVIHDITGVTTGWQDFIVLNDKIIAFVGSSDEDHANMDGEIHTISMSTWAVESTIAHNLGHCNTVHYDSATDVLLIGNLPGATGLAEAIYLIYDFSTLLADDIDWDVIAKTVIDVSGEAMYFPNLCACFGEHNDGVRDIVYISGNLNVNWMKIQLGMGTNDLGSGTYGAADADKYNGSYAVIWQKTYSTQETSNEEVIQGIDFYKGRVLTANGHTGMKGAMWSFGFGADPYVKKDIIYNAIFSAAGVELEVDSEGMCVHGGKIYHGIMGEGYMSICEYEIV